ncbi:MAG: beta/gamma crystallin-related protein [Rhizobium sp.]
MNALLRNVLLLFGVAFATQSSAQITVYEREGFRGQSFTTEQRIGNFEHAGFNDRGSSIMVHGDRWEVCEDVWFKGRCVVLRPGRYPSLQALGLNSQVASMRTVSASARIDENRYAPGTAAEYDHRNNERLYEADVVLVRAVVGPPEQRCWLEREQIPQERAKANVPAAIAGALIGGILGHQVGGGRGKDIATVGGAVAGAAVGANVGRDDDGQPMDSRNVQHCSSTPSQARPEFWDVTYNFRGQEHRIQMTTPPGATVTVNDQGEPRN